MDQMRLEKVVHTDLLYKHAPVQQAQIQLTGAGRDESDRISSVLHRAVQSGQRSSDNTFTDAIGNF